MVPVSTFRGLAYSIGFASQRRQSGSLLAQPGLVFVLETHVNASDCPSNACPLWGLLHITHVQSVERRSYENKSARERSSGFE